MANSPAKRMLRTITYSRKLQARSPGRKRLRLIVSASTPREVVGEREEAALSDINEASSPSSSCFDSEVTFDSGAKHWRKLPHTELRHNTAEVAARSYPGEEFRRITRSYAKQKKLQEAQEKRRSRGGEVTFLADPSSEGGNTNPRFSSVKIDNSADNAFSGVTMSDTSHVSGEFGNIDTKMVEGTRKRGYKGPEFSDSSCHKFVSAENRVLKQLYDSPALEEGHTEQDIDLTCSEHLSNSEESPDISSCRELTLSQLGSDIIPCGSGDSSFVYESSDEGFKISRDKSTPSFFPTFLRLGLEFSPSGLHGASVANGDEYEHEFTLMRFEDRDDEESYQSFRRRERKQALLYDYTEEFSTKTKYGDLIIEQRLVMVNWMVEHANAEDLEFETLFLGVGLMDRFLSRGFFKTAGNLQLLGIACIILATRLEENQPYNCVRRKSFYVRGNSTYSRHEVVAMEWFVQEVLNFQCFHLTTFNFLWFYLKAAKADEAMEKLAKYLAVLSLLDHERLSFWPSTVAAGLVILASLATNHEISCNWVMETHVRTKNDDLSECIQSLEWLVKYAT